MARTDRWLVDCHIVRFSRVADYLLSLRTVPCIGQGRYGYVDDDLYYFDAVHTLHKAAAPKLTYTINIVELSCLPEYKAYTFGLGDISYIQDTNFFGWENINGLKTPRKEEIVISEMTTFFNSPEKNVIKAKNYRDTFEDLFQRLNATTQKLQFYSGSYERAADVVTPEGGITSEAL